MAEPQTRVVCPLCSMSRMNSSFERSDDKKYGSWDENTPIIQIRAQEGGKPSKLLVGTGHYRKSKGPGFPIINTFDLESASGMPEYSEYVSQIAEQLLKVTRIFYEKGLISTEDIENLTL